MLITDAPREPEAPRVFHLAPTAEHTASPGDSVDFVCVLTGCPIPDLAWYHNGVLLETRDPRYSMDVVKSHRFTVGSLGILNVSDDDAGSYRCEGFNDAGTASDSVQLTVAKSVEKRSVEDMSESTLCSSRSPNTGWYNN